MTNITSTFPFGKLALGALLAAAAVFGYRQFFSSGESEAGQYRTEPVERGDLSSAISATGTLGATATVEVGTQVSGTLQSVEVDFNDNVEPGQIIARIDPSTFQARVSQAEAALGFPIDASESDQEGHSAGTHSVHLTRMYSDIPCGSM